MEALFLKVELILFSDNYNERRAIRDYGKRSTSSKVRFNVIMDSYATNLGAVAMASPANRVSTRSARKSKSKVPTPRKLVDSLTSRTTSKNIGDGVLEAYKEFVRESPTFFAYWKEENIPKNAKQDVIFLYDWSRVVLNEDPDYYHASYVDGYSRSHQYILAQAPFNSSTQEDFIRMLAQVHPAAVVFMDAYDSEDAKHIFPSNGKHGGVNIKVEDPQKHAGFSTRLLIVGKLKIKVYCISGWSVEKEPPKDFITVYGKISSAINLDHKSTLMLMCKDGCSRSGIYCLLDIESERYRKKGRIKLSESIKMIRNQRSNCFDTQELFEAGAGVIVEFAKKAQEKDNTTKTN